MYKSVKTDNENHVLNQIGGWSNSGVEEGNTEGGVGKNVLRHMGEDHLARRSFLRYLEKKFNAYKRWL